ncbi:MAG: ABC transporter permease [Steroidobacteraceae bacterium]
MKYLHLIWAALLRRKVRTGLTLLAISAAFLLYGLLGTVNNALTQSADSITDAHRRVTFARGGNYFELPLSLEAQIRRVPGVEAVSFNHSFSGIYQGNPDNQVGGFAVARNYFTLFPEYHCPVRGWRAFDATRTGALVGASLAARYHWPLSGTPVCHRASGATRRTRFYGHACRKC